ncbi:alpha-protein kinase vwkA-like [Dysidea avara]|uniref:alpha-protein kinase vwkA-like n=1 Tax=Dysidea avara TaxID=196820 RepID=UPI003328C487
MNDLEAVFEENSFAEGRFRRAYLGTWTNPIVKRGQRCVVKELKEEYTWEASDWKTAELVQQEAQTLADGFNAYSGCKYPIKFARVDVMRVVTKKNQNTTPALGEYVVAEDYIEGTFKKWCNNYGYISDEAQDFAMSLPAFMHWSWYHTDGQMMAADLQGVKKPDGYWLTDPVILSDVDGEYGCTDMGVEGMAMFFMKHKCNQFCKLLPSPTFDDFAGVILPQTLQKCKLAIPSMMGCTAFRSELKFTKPIKNVVLRTFRNIATRI